MMSNRNACTIRPHLTAGSAVAGAGILALGLVVVTPDFHSARTEVRAVQLAALRLSSAAQSDALEKFFGNQGQIVLQVSKVVAGGAADIPAAVLKTPDAGVTTRLTIDSVNDPAINSQSVQAAALAAPAAGVSILDPILGIVVPIVGLLTNPGALLLFGPIILLVVLACPPCAVFNFVGGIISSFLIDLAPIPAVAAAATATLEARATTGTIGTDEPVLKDVSAPADTGERSADASQAPKTRKPDESIMERATENEQTSAETTTSTKDVTGTAKEGDATEGEALERSDSASTSDEAKPTPRPVVRRSLGAPEQLSYLPHRGNGGRSTTKVSAADDGPATAGSSSAAPSSASSTDGNSTGGESSGGDAGS